MLSSATPPRSLVSTGTHAGIPCPQARVHPSARAGSIRAADGAPVLLDPPVLVTPPSRSVHSLKRTRVQSWELCAPFSPPTPAPPHGFYNLASEHSSSESACPTQRSRIGCKKRLKE